LENALETLNRTALTYKRGIDGWTGSSAEDLEKINAGLIQTERQLLSPDGLPRRPWYRHVLYAPGVYTGYDCKTLPGAREAIEQKRYDEANQQILEIAKALQREAQVIDTAAQVVDREAHGAHVTRSAFGN